MAPDDEPAGRVVLVTGGTDGLGLALAQRLIAEGAVKIDGSFVTDPKSLWDTSHSAVLQVGSRKFVRVLSEKG